MLKGNKAIITGRSHGIGYAVAKALADFVDIFLIHPYYYQWDHEVVDPDALTPEGFDEFLEEYKELSRKYNKPLLTTETCWGSRDDKLREGHEVFNEK